MGWRSTILALLLGAPSILGAASFYVAPQGDDGGPGSLEAPFKTVQHGADALQAGDTLILREGRYPESVHLSIPGTADAPITLRAYPGEQPWLLGARTVTGPWVLHGGRVYQTAWPTQPLQVFCDGRLLNEARWPAAGVEALSNQPVARSDWGSATAVACASLPRLDLTGALIQIMPGQSWCAYTRGIAAHDLATGTLAFDSPIHALAALTPRRGDRFYIFGALGLLSAAGQWYWDSRARLLYVWTPNGGSPQGRVEAGVAPWVLSLDDLSYVRVVGVDALGGGFSLHNTSHCLVQDCELRAPNWIRSSNGYATPQQGGGELSGSDDVWRGGLIHYAGRSAILLSGHRNSVEGLRVEDSDWNWGNDAAIAATSADHCVIRDCSISRVARAAIVQFDSGHLQILRNRMEQVALYSDDIGAFDAWGTDGQGTEIAYNLCRDNQAMWGAGIYLDDHSRNFYVHDNVIERIAWHGIVFKDVNRIEHNTLSDAGHVGIFCAPSLDGNGHSIPLATWDLHGARVEHNQVWEALPLRVGLASPTVGDYGNYGGYAFIGHPGRVELDWTQLDQPWWAHPVPRDLSHISTISFSMDRTAAFDYSISHLRLLPAGKEGDDAAVPVEGSWFAAAGEGSSAALVLKGPPAWGARGDSVQAGWNSLGVALPQGRQDFSPYRGLAFEVAGKASVSYAVHGCVDLDNGPEARPDRGARVSKVYSRD